MAYRARNHKHFRTRPELARDLAIVMASPVTEGTKYGVFRDVAWTWTEGDGKYEGVSRWSKLALSLCRSNGGKKHGLRHEHATPIKVLHELVRPVCEDDQPETVDAVFRLLDDLNIAVIITLTEQRMLDASYRDSMPSQFNDPASDNYRNPMLRFSECPKIEVVELQPSKLKQIVRGDG